MKTKTVFELHPNLKSYHETSDGTPFFHAHDANNHARSLEDKTVKEVKKTSSAAAEKTADKMATASAGLTPMQEAKLKVEAIEAMETVEAVEAAIEGVTAKSVLKAAAAKIEAIKASQAAIELKEKEAE